MLTDEQIAMRRSGVGASEVAAVLGFPSYLSPLDVWLSKVEGTAREDTADLRRGRHLERAVADWYAEQTGATLAESGTLRHPRCPVLLATPDRIATLEDRIYPLELKTTRGSMRHEYGEPGTDDVPQQYLIQVAVQMAVTGYGEAELAALIGGDDLRVYRFARDEALEGSIIEGVERWWRDYVVADRPPPVDSSEAWAERLAKLPRQGITIAATEEMRRAAEDLRQAKRLKRHAEESEKEARARLLALMGDAEGVAGLATYRETKGRAVTDWRAVCADAQVSPILVDKHTTRSPHRVLRLTGGRDDE